MNFFNIKTLWSNAEFIPVKLCIASAYLLAGAYFRELVCRYYGVFLILFGVTLVASLYLWLSKMKKKAS